METEAKKRKLRPLEVEHRNYDTGLKLQIGESGFFRLELFCGTGNLTHAMKRVFPDSFGVDHKVSNQRDKVICLDLTKEDHQDLVGQCPLSGMCLWDHFGIPCGTASRTRFRRLSRRVHGPPTLPTPKFPDGIPGLKGLHAVKLRASIRLYNHMRRLIKQLQTAVWRPTVVLLCRLILCDGQHEHASWSTVNGVFFLTRLWKKNIHHVSSRLGLQQFGKQLRVSLNYPM